jgi:hypothetical protein
MQPVRNTLLHKSEAYFKRFLDERADDKKLQDEVATAHYRLGLIQKDLGQKEAALKRFQSARRIQETLLRQSEASPTRILSLSNTLNAEGNVLAADDPEQSLDKYREAARYRLLLTKEFTDDANHATHVRLLGNTRMNTALVYWDVEQRFRMQQKAVESAEERLKQVRSDSKEDIETQDTADQKQQKALEDANRELDQARSALAESERLRSSLVKQIGGQLEDEARRLHELGQRERLGILLNMKVDNFATFEELKLKEALGNEGVAGGVKRLLLRDLGMGYYNLADLPESGGAIGAVSSLENAISSFELLVVGGERDYEVQYLLALCYQRLGNLVREKSIEGGEDRYEQIAEYYRRAGSLLDEVSVQNPTVAAYQRQRYIAYEALKNHAAPRKDINTFLEASGGMARALVGLLETGPDETVTKTSRQLLFDSWWNMGQALKASDARTQVLAYMLRAQRHLQDLSQAYPETEQYTKFLEFVKKEITSLRDAMKQPSERESSATKAHED